MKQKKLLMIVGGIIFSLFFNGVGNTQDGDRWVYYGTTKDGDRLYYDNVSIIKVNSKVFIVWDKIKYSNVAKDEIIRSNKDNNISIDGWDKLDYGVFLSEYDCGNITEKLMMTLLCNEEGKVLEKQDFLNHETEQVSPDSRGETLLKVICPK
jgi:hypothetical protein